MAFLLHSFVHLPHNMHSECVTNPFFSDVSAAEVADQVWDIDEADFLAFFAAVAFIGVQNGQ